MNIFMAEILDLKTISFDSNGGSSVASQTVYIVDNKSSIESAEYLQGTEIPKIYHALF